MKVIENGEVVKLIQSYPNPINKKLLDLRKLIIDVALQMDERGELQETFKWGEPSYLSPQGSTIRIDRKKSNPDQYAMYFNCRTKLVDTFKEIYADTFKFEGNRAIIFQKDDEIPLEEVKHCISLALIYHQVKNKALLGA